MVKKGEVWSIFILVFMTRIEMVSDVLIYDKGCVQVFDYLVLVFVIWLGSFNFFSFKRIRNGGIDEVYVFVRFYLFFFVEYVSKNREWGCQLLFWVVFI